MFIIFCSDPFDGRQPDSAYAEETAAVRALGGTYALIDYEALVADADARRIVRSIEAPARMTLAIYRGWMLRPSQYERLFAALLTQQLALINTPDAYRHTHHFPESYAVIAAHTPASVWLPLEGDVPMDRVMEVLRPFGAQPVIVKDFVKSWNLDHHRTRGWPGGGSARDDARAVLHGIMPRSAPAVAWRSSGRL